jgi:hypothetical protein
MITATTNTFNYFEEKIFVVYVGINDINDVDEYVKKVIEKILPSTVKGEFIVIPDKTSVNTRIECINPEYISDKTLIKKHTKMIKKINKKINKKLKKYENTK